MITRTKAETFQEPSEEDQLIPRKDRDLGLHQNLIYINLGLEIHVKPSYASGWVNEQSNQNYFRKGIISGRDADWSIQHSRPAQIHNNRKKQLQKYLFYTEMNAYIHRRCIKLI